MIDTEVFVTAQVPLTVQRIKDLLTGAFEGGSNYWIDFIKRQGASQTEAPFLCDVIFAGGHILIQESEVDEPVPRRLDLGSLKTGMQVFANKCPEQFAALLAENDDACTADCFLQCCLLGEVVYG